MLFLLDLLCPDLAKKVTSVLGCSGLQLTPQLPSASRSQDPCCHSLGLGVPVSVGVQKCLGAGE